MVAVEGPRCWDPKDIYPGERPDFGASYLGGPGKDHDAHGSFSPQECTRTRSTGDRSGPPGFPRVFHLGTRTPRAGDQALLSPGSAHRGAAQGGRYLSKPVGFVFLISLYFSIDGAASFTVT